MRTLRTYGGEDVVGLRRRFGWRPPQVVIRGCCGFRWWCVRHLESRRAAPARREARSVSGIVVESCRRVLHRGFERWNGKVGVGRTERVVIVVQVDIRRSRRWREGVGMRRDDLALSSRRHRWRWRWRERTAGRKRRHAGNLGRRSGGLVKDAAATCRRWRGRGTAWNSRAERTGLGRPRWRRGVHDVH